MSKKKIYEEYIKPVTEAVSEGNITEEVATAAEDIFDEPVVLGPIEVKQEENKPAVHTIAKAGTVTNCFKLNIRKEPSLEAEILKVLSKDDDVEILDEPIADGWLPVLLSDGTKGYTMIKYINY